MGSPDRLRPYWRCKRDRKAKRGSRTTGLSKGIVSNPTGRRLIRYLCSHNRSYTHPAYNKFCEKCIKNNGREPLKKIGDCI